MVAQIADFLRYLNVQISPRYLPVPGTTYCNIYDHDYAHLAGAYVPRVWWMRKALMMIAQGLPLAHNTRAPLNPAPAPLLPSLLMGSTQTVPTRRGGLASSGRGNGRACARRASESPSTGVSGGRVAAPGLSIQPNYASMLGADFSL